MLDQPLHTLHIECPLGAIPEAIRIDITNLTLGHPIHVKELTLPEGVKVLEAPEAVVVQLKLPGVEAGRRRRPRPSRAPSPEVIKKEKKAEEGGREGVRSQESGDSRPEARTDPLRRRAVRCLSSDS